MKGLVIYNSFFGKENKLYYLVEDLAAQGRSMGIDLSIVGNREILVLSDRTLRVIFPKGTPDPDFIIFWDKDIALARTLEGMGYRVFNSADAIEVCDDKIRTTFALSGKVKMPKTLIGPFSYFEKNFSERYCENIFEILGDKVVVKEARGSFGMQVYLASSPMELKGIIESLENRPYLIQEYISASAGRDIRVNIVGDRIIGAMERVNADDFRANITIGGVAKKMELSHEERELALCAHKTLGLDYSGVDLLFAEDGPLLCEVNSNVNYLSFEKLTGINMGRELLSYISAELDY